MTHEADHKTGNHGIPSSEGLELGCVRKFGTVVTLYFETLVESDVGEGDTEPSHKTGDGYKEERSSVYSGVQ